jgi:hypothetical protein
MADEKPTIDAALEELASLGRRITELASTFEAHRDAPGGEATPAPEKPVDREISTAVAATDAAAAAPPGEHRRGTNRDQDSPTKTSPRAGLPWSWRGRPAGPILVSTAAHVAALLVLAVAVVTRPAPPERVSIMSASWEDEPLEELAEVEIEAEEVVEPLDVETVPEPFLSDLAAIDPAPVALEQPAAVADQPDLVGGDAFGGGLDAGDLLAALGGESGGEGVGDGAGSGDGAESGGAAAGATFFGKKGTGRTALFMCDNSASYAPGGFQAVLLELSRAVAFMKPDQSFHIVFFSDAAYPMFHPEGIDTFLPATPDNKRKLDAWLGTVELCIGGQGIRKASDLARSLKPDVVYFLSDGDHAESVVDRMVNLQLDKTVVHTFGMQSDVRDYRTGRPDPDRVAKQQECNQKLMRLAAAHGGVFTPVFIAPQVAMAAQARPIKKNRTRGPVWGINLPDTEP